MEYIYLDIAKKVGIELFIFEKKQNIIPSEPTNYLTVQEIECLNKINSSSKKIEFIAIRQFLTTILHYNKGCLDYLPSGKPVLKNGLNISISHSKHLIALAISSNNLGIDIEEPRQQLLKVFKRFLTPYELTLTTNWDLNKLSFCWNLKEAALKYTGNPKIDFRECIQIITTDFTSKATITIHQHNNCKELNALLITLKNHTLAVVY